MTNWQLGLVAALTAAVGIPSVRKYLRWKRLIEADQVEADNVARHQHMRRMRARDD